MIILMFLRPTGGATATAPAAGFDNDDLGVYFAQKASVAVRSPTRAVPGATSAPLESSSPKLSTGAIVGIAVGGTLLLLALSLGGYCCFWRRRRRAAKTAGPSTRRGSADTPGVAYNFAPSYSQAQLGSHTPQTPYFDHNQQIQSQHYQLPANSPPAELSGNDHQVHQVDPKTNMIQVQDASHYSPPVHSISPSQSPHPSFHAGRDAIRSNNSTDLYGSQTSPTPTYSSLGRSPRRPVPPNQTYYSS